MKLSQWSLTGPGGPWAIAYSGASEDGQERKAHGLVGIGRKVRVELLSSSAIGALVEGEVGDIPGSVKDAGCLDAC